MSTEAQVESSEKTVDELHAEIARLRGDLLTIARRVSHDLLSPLGGIISAGDALKESLTDQVSVAQANAVLNSSEELSRLIKRVSFFTQACAVERSPQLMDMNEAVAPALMRLTMQIMSTGATISKPASWPEINGVEDRLQAVWWNLATNALQYAGAAPQIELGWREENGQFRFWVSDNGPGVSSGKLRNLFTPFHRLHELDAPRGLGLAMVQRLVELQGGHCGYESNSRGGACFFFILPGTKADSVPK
jgi:K+-sensing histidine kinase KdpD